MRYLSFNNFVKTAAKTNDLYKFHESFPVLFVVFIKSQKCYFHNRIERQRSIFLHFSNIFEVLEYLGNVSLSVYMNYLSAESTHQ